MSGYRTAASPASFSRFADLVARWRPGHRFTKSLASWSDDELDRVLIATGRSRADLFDVFKGNARHRQLMGLMMAHFGVDRDWAAQCYWDVLKSAEQSCVRCANSKRCLSWFTWGARNDAPRIFCPCAPLYDEMARVARNAPPPSPRERATTSGANESMI